MDMIWPNSAPLSAAAQASLARLRSAVAIANGLAISGRAIELAGLESMAGLLCAQILDLPPENGRALRPSLLAVNQSIANLIATLSVQSLED